MRFFSFCLVPVLSFTIAACFSAAGVPESDFESHDSLPARSAPVVARDLFRRLAEDRPILQIRGNTQSMPSDLSQRPHEPLSPQWSLELGKVSGTDFPSLRIKESSKVQSQSKKNEGSSQTPLGKGSGSKGPGRKSSGAQSKKGVKKTTHQPPLRLQRSHSAPELALKIPTIPEPRPGRASPSGKSSPKTGTEAIIPMALGFAFGGTGIVAAGAIAKTSPVAAGIVGGCSAICVVGSGIASGMMYRNRARIQDEQALRLRPGRPERPQRPERPKSTKSAAPWGYSGKSIEGIERVLVRRAALGKEDAALEKKKAACGCPTPAKRDR